jgi:hypothetical protein
VLAADYRASALGDALGAPERDQLVAWLKANTTVGERIRAGCPRAGSPAVGIAGCAPSVAAVRRTQRGL